jgi:hypothetical protein
MKLRLAAVFAAFLGLAAAAITNVSVQGTTATQAILRYTAPDTGACTVEVSESSSFTPLVHDADAQLFPGSNLDSRSESAANGPERVFVIGKRRAEKAVNGKWYSRALQAYTAHYYRITCGAGQATGSFFTTNIALGNTYNEELPPDPNAGSAGYYVPAGLYAWPEFLDWDKTTGRSETVIDPLTGMLLKRVAMPRDLPTENFPAGDHGFVTVIDRDGAWTNKDAVKGDDGASASFSGSGRNWLLLRDESLAFPDIYQLESMTFSVKGWCGGACAGEDAKIQACITANGVSCWPNESNVLDIALGTTPNPSAFVVAGTQTPIMASWTPAGYQPLTRTDAEGRGGIVNVDTAGNVSGDYFYPNWTAGSQITIAGSTCAITAVKNPKALTINPASCAPALSLPQTGAAYAAGNFGIMIRKKTASTGTINIQYAKYTLAESAYFTWPSGGSANLCSDTLTQNTVTGGLGYRCVFGGILAYWINKDTGDGNYLGAYMMPWEAGPYGWDSRFCNTASITLHGTGPTDPEKFYCATWDHSGREVVLGCYLVSSNQQGSLGTWCVPVTNSAAGRDFVTLVQEFTAGYTPSFDAAKFGGCSITGLQNGRLVMGCPRSYQDTIAWTVVFDPDKVGTGPGCVGSGAPGCVVAAATTWAIAPARWCVNHVLNWVGDADTAVVGGKYLGGEPMIPGGGPYLSTLVSGWLGATPSIAAGTGSCPAGSKGCDIVTVDGEPCDPSPGAGEGGNCPKNRAQEYLQDASAGDIFTASPGLTEYVRLISKNGYNWQVERGIGWPGVQSHTGSVTLSAYCMSQRLDVGASSWMWAWDYLADPHGLNATGATIRAVYDYDHAVMGPDVIVGAAPSYETQGSGYAVLDGPGFGPPNKFVSSAPAFAGTRGVTAYIEMSQDHASRSQRKAPPAEKKWFLDQRQLSGPGPSLVDRAMPVSGQLYKFASQTSDGDNLTQIGGPAAFLGGVNRKKQPTMAFCGNQALADASSPAKGNVISDGPANAYQYCVARGSGECRAGSTRGDIYLNCPYMASRPDGTYGCYYAIGDDDMCVYNTGAYLNVAAQIGYQYSDAAGALGRRLTYGLTRYRLSNVNANARTLPDGSWLLLWGLGMNGSLSAVLAGKMPPFPAVDTVDRTTFLPMVLNLTPPASAGVDNAIVEFGYAENGPPGQSYCTSRREACVAASATVADNPFQFPSDGTDGTEAGIQGMSCATGCSIAIPALPQRILYYRVKYRDHNNNVVAETALQVVAAP